MLPGKKEGGRPAWTDRELCQEDFTVWCWRRTECPEADEQTYGESVYMNAAAPSEKTVSTRQEQRDDMAHRGKVGVAPSFFHQNTFQKHHRTESEWGTWVAQLSNGLPISAQVIV